MQFLIVPAQSLEFLLLRHGLFPGSVLLAQLWQAGSDDAKTFVLLFQFRRPIQLHAKHHGATHKHQTECECGKPSTKRTLPRARDSHFRFCGLQGNRGLKALKEFGRSGRTRGTKQKALNRGFVHIFLSISDSDLAARERRKSSASRNRYFTVLVATPRTSAVSFN